MLGFAFLFGAALFALPLAGLPILLHMLYRRKSPVILFSTLRFIKASIQQTAARRRIQRWLLLACRVLLLALLIWAMAQPVRLLATGWFEPGKSMIAAVVVDTSYSMQLRQQEMTLLDKANDTVLELLREPLKSGKVAIFRSQAPAGEPERLLAPAEIQSQWTPLKPQPAPRPLADRISAARTFLARQAAEQKWLVVLTDLQSREFPAPLPAVESDDTRIVLFDLHPEKAASSGIASVQIEPEQPVPGFSSEVVVEAAGAAGDSAFFDVNINRLDGTRLNRIQNVQVRFETTGRARTRVVLKDGLPLERWVLVGAQLQREDDLPWDNSRYELMELPPRQPVTFIGAASQPQPSMFLRLGLDPWEGTRTSWPLDMKKADDLSGKEQVALVVLTEWPDTAKATKLATFAQNGGTVVLFLQPGLEQSWAKLPPAQQKAITPLLPSMPAPNLPGGGLAGATGTYRVVPPARPHRVLQGISDMAIWQASPLTVRRFVPFALPSDPKVSTLLHLSPFSGDIRTLSYGFVYARSVGTGQVYTWASLPSSQFVSPAVHPAFIIIPGNMSLRAPEQRDVQNIELGQAMSLAGSRYAGYAEFDVQTPSNQRSRIKPTGEGAERRFVFPATDEPGLYYWRKPNDSAIVAVGNVRLPAAESDLIYKPADNLVGNVPNCVVVRSMADFQAKMSQLAETQEPRWTWPIAAAILLICAEALLGSLSHLWKPISLRALLPTFRPAESQ